MYYMRLIRPVHWAKNFLIFLPAFLLADASKLISTAPYLFAGFAAFSFASSFVYVFNDLKDIEKDREHPIKKLRPLASGKVPIAGARALMAVLSILALAVSLFFALMPQASETGREPLFAFLLLVGYVAINLLYSVGLKNYPIIDVVILSSGFVIRVFYGSFLSGVPVSSIFCVTVVSFSLAMSIGKRRNENVGSRAVLLRYTKEFLDKNFYLFLGFTVVFYAIWVLEKTKSFQDFSGEQNLLVWSIPILMIVLLRYSLNIERAEDGDPLRIIMGDKWLLLVAAVFAVFVGFALWSMG